MTSVIWSPQSVRDLEAARGSAMECAAIVNLALVRDLASYVDCRRGRALLVRLVQMLTKLQLTMRGRL